MDVNSAVVKKCGCKERKNRCCKECTDNLFCNNITIDRLRNTLYATRDFLAKFGEGVVQEDVYGYKSLWNNYCEEDAKKISVFSELIEEFYVSLFQDKSTCLCDTEVENIIQKINKLLPLSCARIDAFDYLNLDKSNLDTWIKQHPTCVSFEKWERATIKFTPKFSIKVNQVECKVAYNFLVKEVKCDLVASIKAVQNNCKLKYDVKATENDCKLNYEILAKSTDCKLDYKTYAHLINCGVDYKVVADLVSCGLNFKVKNNEIEVMVDTESIGIGDFNIDLITEICNPK